MRYKLFNDDCLSVLKRMPDNFVDSIVTDPPAGISFMGKGWDSNKGGRDNWIQWMTEVFTEVHRVLKPGGHGLVWALPRTSHWTATALEDAGFEVRDVITHLFGSGFPKSHNISKAIDKKMGKSGKVVGEKCSPDGVPYSSRQPKVWRAAGFIENKEINPNTHMLVPESTEAQQWEGFGTALKPSNEHWILIRKPLSEKNIADNVLKHGTGGINIDACRVGYEDTKNPVNQLGRFPANTILTHHADCEQIDGYRVVSLRGNHKIPVLKDLGGVTNSFGIKYEREYFNYGDEQLQNYNCHEECPIRKLDEQSGETKSARQGFISRSGEDTVFTGDTGWKGSKTKHNGSVEYGYKGGASRFFQNFEPKYDVPFIYQAKPSKKERNAGEVVNRHPTVKSIKLMSYLIKLVTPPNGIILDPFLGSGSTGCAAMQEGFKFIGIEKEEEYFDIGKARIEHYAKQTKEG